MNRCVIDLHYLPCMAWFAQIQSYDEVVLEKHEHYEKQSYRNRCHIRAAHGLHRLVIPVKVHGKVPLHAVEIDYSQKWVNNHWRTLVSAYRLSPFFEHYEQQLYQIFSQRPRHLYSFNLSLLQACLQWLGTPVKLSETSAYQLKYAESIADLRNLIHPKKHLPPGCTSSIRYQQVFGTDFMENLSIIDLLCCQGPRSAELLKAASLGIRTN